MAELVLIRPGSTDFDEQKRIQGALNLPLNSHGEQQVQEIIDQLTGTKLDVIYTAPSEPAASTAKVIGETLGVAVKELSGLRNWDQGLWQGLKIDDIRRQYPKVIKQWKDCPENICAPEGENVGEALERACKALDKPLRKNRCFAVVASEPIATFMQCLLTGNKSDITGPICAGGGKHEVVFIETNGMKSIDIESFASLTPAPGGKKNGKQNPIQTTHGSGD